MGEKRIPLDIVEAALRLAQGRRLARPKDAEPLPPIRSLNYSLPIVDELSHAVPPAGYLDYLRLTVPEKSVKAHQTPRTATRTQRRPAQLRLPFDAGAGPENDGSS